MATPSPHLTFNVSAERLRQATAAKVDLRKFCDAIGLDAHDPHSCVLYLTFLLESEGLSGPQLNRRLTQLDLARCLEGDSPVRRRPEVQLFLRGLLRTARVHQTRQHSDPLYREVVASLVEEVIRASAQQTRMRAAIMLIHESRWPAVAVARLQWRHVDLRRRDRTVVRWPQVPGGWTRPDLDMPHEPGRNLLRQCLDRARDLPEPSPYVTWPPARYQPTAAPQVSRAARILSEVGGDPVAALEKVSTSPRQARDRAALLLGFHAALTTQEARSLRQRDIQVTTSGLLLKIPSRRRTVGIATDPKTSMDPVAAWEQWLEVLTSHHLRSDNGPALLGADSRGPYLHSRVISAGGLNLIVQRPLEALGISGLYGWQSLRWGSIRSALRANERLHEIAAFANTGVDALHLHYRRENVIRHSVAGQLGL